MHTQRGDGVLDARGHPVGLGSVSGHQIAGGADDEQVTRLGSGDHLGDDAGVGAADEQRVRCVMGGQVSEELRLRREDVRLETGDAVGESLQWVTPFRW
jgi:hypothetical protein